MKFAFIPIVLLMLFAGAAYAQVWNTTTYCLDNNTQLVSVYRQICIAGRCDNVTRESPNVCEWGCNVQRGECYDDPVTRWVYVIIIAVVVIVIIYFLRRRIYG